MTTKTNNEWKKGYTIRQIKPDPNQDESSYSTAITKNGEYIPIVGYGFTQGEADAKALSQFLSFEREKWEKEKLIIPKGKTHSEHDECEDCIYLGCEKERQRLRKSIQSLPCKEECAVLKSRVLKLLS